MDKHSPSFHESAASGEVARNARSPSEREDTEGAARKRFEQQAAVVLGAGIMLTALGIGGPVFLALQRGSVVWDLVLTLFLTAGFGLLLLVSGIGLRRRLSWARKLAVVLCCIGILILAVWLIYLAVGCFRMYRFLSNQAGIMEYWALKRPNSEAPWADSKATMAKAKAMTMGFMILGLAGLVVILWRIWRTCVYFCSDEARMNCRDLPNASEGQKMR